MLDTVGQELRARLLEVFSRSADEPFDDGQFEATALRIFRFQFERNAPFAAYCRRRGRSPDNVHSWAEIPAVPTAAFREVALVVGDPSHASAVFRTSGTTRAGKRRGTHYIPDVSLYHASLLPHFARSVLPDAARIPMLSFIPPAAEMPDSSLSHMVQVVIDHLSADGGGYFASTGQGLHLERLSQVLRVFEDRREPVCLLGTSFAFVHWTDHLRERGERFRLASGSRLMDTGGYKGRSREVPETELRAAYRDLLGLDPDFCVNEYGMTELCSQAYDTTLRDRFETGGPVARRKKGPRWMRTRVVDPDTLQPSPSGVGLLQHCDLANLGSVIVVQTEDLGRAVDDGFVVLGRASGAPPRGCSIAMDELLSAVRER